MTPATYAGLAALHPLGRLGEISDVVDAILYLERATFVTGEVLHVDGGQSRGQLTEGIGVVVEAGRRRACRSHRGRRSATPACGGRYVAPHRTMLYSSAHARPSSISLQCSSGMPPPLENHRSYSAPPAVRFERGDDRVDVAARERTQVLGHDVRPAQLGVGLQQGRAVHVAAGQRHAAVVDPQLVDPPVRFAVGDDHERKRDPAVLTVEVQHHLLEAVSPEDDVLDVLDRDVALHEPRRACRRRTR